MKIDHVRYLVQSAVNSSVVKGEKRFMQELMIPMERDAHVHECVFEIRVIIEHEVAIMFLCRGMYIRLCICFS